MAASAPSAPKPVVLDHCLIDLVIEDALEIMGVPVGDPLLSEACEVHGKLLSETRGGRFVEAYGPRSRSARKPDTAALHASGLSYGMP